jgi:hypothetical protein
MVLICVCCYIKSVTRHEFLILDTYPRTLSLYVSKDVRIRGCSVKPKGVREQKRLGNPGLRKLMRTLLSTTFNNEGLVTRMDCTNKFW